VKSTLLLATLVTLQYLGHSCFVITTPAGHRLLIDPYASGEWPGLALPTTHADRVLITNANWDHAAWRAVRGKPKVTEGPGTIEKDDYTIVGLAGRHADTGGEGIGYVNTVYVVRTGGIRLCHLGDNGPLDASPGLASAIGPVDVLMLPVDADKRVLTYEQAKAWVDALSPRVVIPMHYKIPGVSLDTIEGIGTITEWLSQLWPGAGPVRLEGDTVSLDRLPPPGAKQVWVFRLPHERDEEPPVPAIAGRAEAEAAKRRAEVAVADGDLATALAEFTRASAIDPNDADVLMKIGLLQLGRARPDLALDFLKRAATLSAETDPKRASLCWLSSGMALDVMGRRDEAKQAYEKVIAIGVNDEHQVEQARGYLSEPYRQD